ncbi:hypothetical protein ACGLWX_09675 [Halomonas sp. HMF6819]|uniref:hypothetical protein n=1 Tax=Halomonas sp. HMF6819 TaxID=3373085 RepID=UPI003797A5AE
MGQAFTVGVASVFSTVIVNRPGREEEQFTAEIRVRDMDEQKALHEKQQSGEVTGNDHVREDLLAITGLADAKGNDVEATPETIDKIWKDPYAFMGIMRAWHRVQQGLPEETAKN